MGGPAHHVVFPRAEILGDHDCSAAADADEEANEQVDESAGAAHRGQCGFAHDFADDDGIGGNVNLLEKNTAPNGDEKADHLCGNTALGQVDLPFFQSSHGSSLYLFQIKKRP